MVNSTVLRGDAVAEAARLRDELDGEIVVYASRELVRALLEAGPVDEIRLMVFPVLLGAGERLFGETTDARPLRLLEAERIGGNLAHLAFEVVRG